MHYRPAPAPATRWLDMPVDINSDNELHAFVINIHSGANTQEGLPHQAKYHLCYSFD